MTILDEIFAYKRQQVARLKLEIPQADLQASVERLPPARDFVGALRSSHPTPALIAEIKKASPSRGLLAPDFNPLQLTAIYREHGAAAISVLTEDRYFQGSLETLQQTSTLPDRLPLLRKDFIFDPYQVYEARLAGADAVLLIAAMLEPPLLCALHAVVQRLGMAALVEVHTLDELRRALDCQPALVGINNRDLRDFNVSLQTTLDLRPQIPAGVTVVAESGIHSPADLAVLASAEVDAVLVGEALVTAADVGLAVRQLSGRVP